MNSYAARRTRPPEWTQALLVSLAVHFLLALIWIILLAQEFFDRSLASEEKAEIADDAPVMALTAERLETLQEAFEATPEPEPAPEPEPPEKSFAHTQPTQESASPVESPRYFGERDTAAANSGEIVDNGLEVPTQDGADPRSANDLELVDSDFADGEEEGAPGTPGEPLPLSETALTTENSPPQEPTEAPEPREETLAELPDEPVEQDPLAEETAEERLEKAQAKARELLALDESLPVPLEEETPEEEDVREPVEETLPKPQPAVAQNAGGVSGDRGLEGGFDREAQKTRVSGSIGRKGENSLAVEATVKGRFLAQVNREIEKAWQRECILRREHILPGVLAVSFVLDDTGKVTGFRFDSRIAGGAIQEGFTMMAIKKAKIPAMPDEMKSELDGRQLEMNLTFYF
ncbi:hypothetical protein [Roseibacillus ishigakijimensis]|uniref:TonB C-terminal domain-containing protein n=1 Tax=Roseibacillus ishigakijimensis TaxID=454146 RepID=A0A934RR33_9BACT|nr:hypothetical protein [Roseibacillus ishigakijimensis]MBK1832986.1 hypothetical protein [Roseibacillus ishigakijimensis]